MGVGGRVIQVVSFHVSAENAPLLLTKRLRDCLYNILTTTPMEYKDAVGVEIKQGDHIVYSNVEGRLQLGRVLELREMTVYGDKVPAIKIQGARREWEDNGYVFKKMKPSSLWKLENVLVLNQNLVAQMTLL